MAKEMLLLRAGELAADRLLGVLREVVDRGAVDRVQLNVTDEPVSGAMAIAHLDPPVRAVVSTWGADAVALAEALAESTGALVHGYAVAEHRRLDPPEHWDGRRADALANVAVLRRPAELDRAEWLHRWFVDHTPVAIRTQATFGYVQNVVTAALTPGVPPVDAIVEELFPATAVRDMHAFYGSGGDGDELDRRLTAMLASVARIGADRDLDLVPTSRYLLAGTRDGAPSHV